MPIDPGPDPHAEGRASPAEATARVELLTIRARPGDPADASTLSAAERARAGRFVRPADGARYIRFRAALRRILAARLDRAPAKIALCEGAFGKPCLAESPPRLHFNLSHCGDLALLALCREASVGVDIETLRPLRAMEELSARRFTPRERREWSLLRADQKPHAFFRAWTRKEACLKAVGEGLSRPPETVCVTLAPEAAPRLRAYGEGPLGAWSLHDVAPAPGVIGAVAVRAETARVEGPMAAPPGLPPRPGPDLR